MKKLSLLTCLFTFSQSVNAIPYYVYQEGTAEPMFQVRVDDIPMYNGNRFYEIVLTPRFTTEDIIENRTTNIRQTFINSITGFNVKSSSGKDCTSEFELDKTFLPNIIKFTDKESEDGCYPKVAEVNIGLKDGSIWRYPGSWSDKSLPDNLTTNHNDTRPADIGFDVDIDKRKITITSRKDNITISPAMLATVWRNSEPDGCGYFNRPNSRNKHKTFSYGETVTWEAKCNVTTQAILLALDVKENGENKRYYLYPSYESFKSNRIIFEPAF